MKLGGDPLTLPDIDPSSSKKKKNAAFAPTSFLKTTQPQEDPKNRARRVAQWVEPVPSPVTPSSGPTCWWLTSWVVPGRQVRVWERAVHPPHIELSQGVHH